MLDKMLIIMSMLFLVIQIIVSCQISFLLTKSKKEGGVIISNLWFVGIPYLLLVYTVIMLICAIKTNDTILVLLPIVLSMCFLFDMHIFYANGRDVEHYYFLLQKNVCKSLTITEKLVVAEFEDKKVIIRIPHKKVKRLESYMK